MLEILKVAVLPETGATETWTPLILNTRLVIPEGFPVPEIVTVKEVTVTPAVLGSFKTACSTGTLALPDNCVEPAGFEGPAKTVTVTGVGVSVGVLTEVLVEVNVGVLVAVWVGVLLELFVAVAVEAEVKVLVALLVTVNVAVTL